MLSCHGLEKCTFLAIKKILVLHGATKMIKLENGLQKKIVYFLFWRLWGPRRELKIKQWANKKSGNVL